MIEVAYEPSEVRMFTSGKRLPLTELSFCLENAAAYMLGRGVWHMTFARKFTGDNNVNLHVNVIAQVHSKAMTFGFPATLASMAKEDFFPKTIKTSDFFTMPGHRQQVCDGQNRLVEYSDEHTIILSRDLKPTQPLGLLCYGISDFVTGFFYHGAKVIDAQFSLSVVQYKIDKGFDKTWLTQYLLGKNGTDYPIHRNVDAFSV